MSGIRDTATVTLNVNGAQAKQMMADIEAKIKQTEATIESLKKSMAAPKDIEKAKKQLKTYQKQLDEMRSATEGVNRALENIELATPRELEKALRTLNRQLKDMEPGSDVWDSHIGKIKELKVRLAELRDATGEQQSVWENFMEWSQGAWPAIDLLKGWYDNLIGGLREYVDAYAEMDQEMANVRKFTGMSADEVDQLNESFKQIDTRSSREQLNQLAQEAGRLGLSSQEDVLGFVRAADKINVALDDLGDGATLTLSKLTDIFGDKDRFGVEQSLLKTGSVINELSQSSSASASYIANFAERLSGVGNQARLSVPQIMALGAVLDSTGQKVEASSTAVSQVLVRMMQDPAKYARVAGLEIESFSRLLREDANEALLTFLETLRNAGGLEVLAPMFKDMGENGSRAIATLSTLAQHIDIVRQRQEEANVAFQEGTSIDNEFAVQNGTVQAEIEKSMKRFQELRIELGEKLAPIMAHFLSTTSAMTRVVSIAIDFFLKCKGVIIPLATAIIAYYTAVGIATVAQKAWTAAVVLGNTAVVTFKYTIGLLQVGIIALTHGTRAAGTAFTFLNVTMKANPFGLVISLLATLTVVITGLSKKTEDYNSKMRDAIKTASSYNEAMEKELTELDKLIGAMEGATEGTKEYDKAKNQLLSKYGAYLEGLVSEEEKIIDLETAYKRLAEAIRIANEERGIQEARQAVDDAYFEKMGELQKQLSESLMLFGASEREAARLAARVSTAMSANRSLDNETITRLNELSANSPNQGVDEGVITGLLSRIAPDSQNSDMWAWLIDQIPQPSAVINQMYDAKKVRNSALNEVDIIQREQRPLGALVDGVLDSMISFAEEAVANGGGSVLKIADAIKGTAEFVDVTAEEAQRLRDELKGEKAYRQGLRAGNGDGITTTVDPPTPDPDPDKNTDRFAEEKAWRERQEAEARIAYAKDESIYAEYTKKMNQIAVDYHQKLLDREDVVGDERLSIQADYWEAVNKRTNAGNKQKIDDENNSYDETIYKLNESLRVKLAAENLSAKERETAEKVHREAVELAELNHFARLVDLYKEGSAEQLRAQQAYQTAQLNAQKRHQQEYEKQEAEYAKIKADIFGDNPQEKQQKYDAALAALQTVYAREIVAAGDNADEKLRIEEAFLQAQAALRKQYGLEAEEDTRNSMERAVAASVEWLNSDGGKALTGAISTLTQGMSSIFSGLSTLVQAELEIQTASITKRYDSEIQAAQGNSYKVAKLEKKKEAEIAKTKNEANKKMFAMQVIQAVAQTAQNALSAYGSAAAVPVVGYILAPVAAAMAVAAGTIQIAAIKKQQQASEAQGYSQGGFTKPGAVNEPAGIVHAGEWVASQKLLANPVARPMIEALDYAQRTNTIGSLRADDVSRSITANNSLVRIAESDNGTLAMVAAAAQMSSTVAGLTDRLNEPFVTVNTVTGDYGIQQAQDDYTKLMNNITPKSKRKK